MEHPDSPRALTLRQPPESQAWCPCEASSWAAPASVLLQLCCPLLVEEDSDPELPSCRSPQHLSSKEGCGPGFPASHRHLPPCPAQPSTEGHIHAAGSRTGGIPVLVPGLKCPWPGPLCSYNRESAGYSVVHLKWVSVQTNLCDVPQPADSCVFRNQDRCFLHPHQCSWVIRATGDASGAKCS